MWGSNHYCKLGTHTNGRNWEVPKPVIWQVVKKNNLCSDSDDGMGEAGDGKLKTYLKDEDFFKKKGQEYIKSIRSLNWGESHGLLLDKKGRVFSMGRTMNGCLGLQEEDED